MIRFFNICALLYYGKILIIAFSKIVKLENYNYRYKKFKRELHFKHTDFLDFLNSYTNNDYN